MRNDDTEVIEIEVIARIQTDFPTTFGIPRQSGLIRSLEGRIIFEPLYRNKEAVKGIEQYSHLWLIWQFSEKVSEGWSFTARPPSLGGKIRVGVFASRSPYRPNHMGLSSVKLERVEMDEKLGPVLYVSGADLKDNTPIFDIKPYVPTIDSHPEAVSEISREVEKKRLAVDIPRKLVDKIPSSKLKALRELLAEDPRRSHKEDSSWIFCLPFGGMNIRFRVEENHLIVVEVENL
jgi:tRNA (adenine37-N6)-methyltransferase